MSRLTRLTHSLSSSSRRATTLGIRAEDPLRRWERRVPLSPSSVSTLLSSSSSSRGETRVIVQPSEKRVFRDHEYAKVGAEVRDELGDAGVVVGVKEIPVGELRGETTYVSFAHVHKGQGYNLPLLAGMLQSGSRFVDWELVTDDQGVRTTAFGWLAGFSGMHDALSLFGTKALALGSATPFLPLPRPYMLPSVSGAQEALRRVGEDVKLNGTGKSLGPIVVVILGKGRVGMGAKAVLDELPTKWVKADQLPSIVRDPNTNLKSVYACQVGPEDYLVAKDGSPYNREAYYANPDRFQSLFHQRIAPYSTLILNGGFFSPGSPPIMTTEQLAEVKRTASSHRLLHISDVSCDFGGGLPFVTAPTTIDDPVYQLDAASGQSHQNASSVASIQVSAIEILPSQLPLDASTQFSESALPYVQSLLSDPTSASSSRAEARALRRATIVENGELTEKHRGLYKLLEELKTTYIPTPTNGNLTPKPETRITPPSPPKMQRALVLGSGLVAAPAIRVLASRPHLHTTIASNSLAAASILAEPYENVEAVLLDASDTEGLRRLVREADVVLSLLPATLHVGVAEMCIASGTSLVTASYTSEAMKGLTERAKEADVVLLNELGLDPGIDHCSAMRLIDEATRSGNKITSFVSFCGGLPAPEDSNGPLGYKFSWSPRGVLTAAGNDALFRVNSKEVAIAGKDLLRKAFSDVPIIKGFKFEGLANRNSLSYLEEYGLPSDLPTIMRGTLRYPSFSKVMDVFSRLGFLSQEPMKSSLHAWHDFVPQQLASMHTAEDDGAGFQRVISPYVDGDEVLSKSVVDTLIELGLIPSKSATPPPSDLPPLPSGPTSPLDLLSLVLAHKLRYEPNERDAVILHHELGTVNAQGEPELFTSTMVQYGAADSAMATTVGVPIALGALLCLDGKIQQRGLVSPASKEVWVPLLASLERYGIKMKEDRRAGRGVLDSLEEQVQQMS